MIVSGTWDLFAPYGALHLVTVVVCATLMGTVAALGRRLRRQARETILRTGLSLFGLAFWVFYNTWWNWRGIDFYNGLPLHVCDLSGLIAPLALLTLDRRLRAVLYFWAITLSAQAFIQPILTAGPAHFEFWAFWMAHSIIVGSAIYDLVALQFRPTWNDLRQALVAGAAYLAVIIPINLFLGSNYGYVGNPPAGRKIPPFVEALGAWPGRVLIMAMMAALAFVLVLLPWRAIDRFRNAPLAEAARADLAP
jgi:hypothetical integral membrane protein (TIGR02206 family)